jgi:hypothetical protein
MTASQLPVTEAQPEQTISGKILEKSRCLSLQEKKGVRKVKNNGVLHILTFSIYKN